MKRTLRIGTRDSQLAVWQATLVQDLLKAEGIASELIFIKSEGDIDTVTPLYALGVQGIFTKTLDAALLNNRIDIAVHSMKDVPTQLAQGLKQAAVLERASYKDIFVAHPNLTEGKETLAQPQLFDALANNNAPLQSEEKIYNEAGPSGGWVIGTSSIRRIAQWLHRFPHHRIENLRGNVNTRLKKLEESTWSGAIFAAAGLERINLRPEKSIDLDWMLPAPSQGAIMVVCRQDDEDAFSSCKGLNNEATALCTKIEKDFLRILMGGCSTPISALAEIKGDKVFFRGNICSTDGAHLVEVSEEKSAAESISLGEKMAERLLKDNKARDIITAIRHARS